MKCESVIELKTKQQILVIEDNLLTTKLVKLVLTTEGYEVIICGNGAEALATIEKNKPDLILLDMHLPDTTGLVLVKTLRNHPHAEHIPIIAFSGFVSMIEEVNIANSGFTDFLLKPVEPSILIKSIANHLVKNKVNKKSSGLKYSVLIIDDDSLQLKFTELQFIHAGFDTMTAINGIDGLVIAKKKRPNIIVSDVLMPKMDGFQLCKAIKLNPLLTETPVVLVSANYIEEIDKSLASKIGANGYVYRSLGIQKVIDTVVNCLNGKNKKIALPLSSLELSTITDTDIHSRMLQQLERQVSLNLASRHRNFVQHTILGHIGDFANSLLMNQNDSLNLDDILAGCLDSAGLSHGIFYFLDEKNALDLKAQFGFSNALGLLVNGFGFTETIIDLIRTEKTIAIPSASLDEGISKALLASCDAKSILFVPVHRTKKTSGLLMLFSNESLLIEEEWIAFGRNVASQFTQATELSEVFTKLVLSEQKFRQLAENIKEAFFLFEPTQEAIIYLSQTAQTIWDKPHQILSLGFNIWIESVIDKDRDTFIDLQQLLITTGKCSAQVRIKCSNQQTKWISITGNPIYDDDGKLSRVAGIVEDINTRKLAEEKIQHLNRLYALLSDINSVIVRARNKKALLNDACQVAVKVGGFDFAWIGLFDENNKRLNCIEQFGLVDTEHTIAQLFISTSIEQLCQNSILENVVNSQELDWYTLHSNDLDSTHNSLTLHCLHHFKSYICLPLICNQHLVGLANFYSQDAIEFDQSEIKLLTQMAIDISYALDGLKNKERLQYTAFHDPLTGLANRVTLQKNLERTIENNVDQPCCLMLININHFRNINDTLGHKIGDQLLKDIAARLLKTIWKSDTVACLGGDEFAVFIPHLTSDKDAKVVAKKVNSALQKGFQVGGIPLHVEASIGIATYPCKSNNAEQLWMFADIALSTARKNQDFISIYHPSDNNFNPKNLSLLAEIRSAIEHNELVLHWQPKVDLSTMKCTDMEALVRWQHPTRGLLYPDEFIPHVEYTGLIEPLTHWVAVNAINQAKKWNDQGFTLAVAINISVRNLQEQNINKKILQIAHDINFPINKITIEVTESAVMKNSKTAKLILNNLREAGTRIAIDDFGTGQSSLAYLKNLPVTDIKIDKSFVMDLNIKGNKAIVKSTVELAKNLGLSTTAEGVESQEALDYLIDVGCNIAQGYFLSKPLPAQQFITWVCHYNKGK
ncbi:EAL domain-containing protein [Pseudoalteromonas porphyrae]|uniref:EAL domain-containing protein n=1 Tax=Pseudoalteromonas porphyrae TaxID=187330 RepID=UPI0006BA9762|nr:EAL domain-containing protein [Pseudoalteromonas porphyrae]